MADKRDIADKVKFVGTDKYGRSCYKFGIGGKVYCGKNARNRAIRQGYALLKGFL